VDYDNPTPTMSSSDEDLHAALMAAQQAVARLRETVMNQERLIADRDQQIEALAIHAARANTDELTGLPTRRQLRYWWDDLGNDPGKVVGAIMLIDLNGLHDLNERYGHDGGDKIIVRVAESISALTRDGGPILAAARLGGDEFFAAIRRCDTPGQTIEEASNAAQKIIDLVHEPLHMGGEHNDVIHPAVSIGIRVDVVPELYRSMRFADVAMFDAKTASRDGTGNGRYSISIPFGPADSD
jgi:diguanylate cyclase (GGDEF)-like protein